MGFSKLSTTRNAEENQSDLYIWDEEGLFYDYTEVPQPDGELIVVYWIFNEELDQVGKAQISLFNNNLEIDSIFIEPTINAEELPLHLLIM